MPREGEEGSGGIRKSRASSRTLIGIPGAVRGLHGGGGNSPTVATPQGIFLDLDLDGPRGGSQMTKKSLRRPRQNHFFQDEQQVQEKNHVCREDAFPFLLKMATFCLFFPPSPLSSSFSFPLGARLYWAVLELIRDPGVV